MRTLVLGVLTLAALAGPVSSAHALCAVTDGPPDPFAEVESAPVAFIGTAGAGAESGGELLSPAVFTVEHRFDRWKRPTEQVATQVSTGPNGETRMVGDLLSVRAGERWLIVGGRIDGQVDAGPCSFVTQVVDGAAAPALRFPGGAATVSPRWADTRGRRLVIADGPVPALPSKARALRGAGITAARLIHRGRVQTLRRSGGWWRYRGAVAGDRVVVATKNGFWTAALR